MKKAKAPITLIRRLAVAEALALSVAAIGIKPHNAALDHNEVCFANEARFGEAFFSQGLTEYSVGWKDPNDIEAITDFIAPPVEVPRFFEYAIMNNPEEFYRDTDDERAIGSDFKEVEYTETKTTGKTANRGLAIRVDLDQVSDKVNWREDYTNRLLRRIKRSSLVRAFTLVSAAATNTAKTWDTTAGKDPDKDVESELVSAADTSGLRPNRVVFGDTAWDKRRLSHRAQNTAGGYASAGLKPDELAGYLGVEGVRVSRERFQSSAAAKSQVVNNVVLLSYGITGANTDDGTNAKRFWSPCENGTKYRVYERQLSAKIYEIVVEHYELPKITSTLGLRKLTIS
ncbi:MAG TPA: hypothetical protein VF773_10860 [Verrucomicrobiae bacterium]